MRINQPVTGREYVLLDEETIVSKTDLKGNINYVNADFVRISGFSREELMGAPQNIVRHPDMPPEAFADMWAALRAGQAWTGLVKNRCKNGDHYWVEAHAAPVLDNGSITGYTSIRIKPGREAVQAAERAYARIREGDRSLFVHRGQVHSRAGRWRAALGAIRLRSHAAGAVLLNLAGLAAVGWLAARAHGAGAACAGLATLLSSAAMLLVPASRQARQLGRAGAAIDRMSAGDLSAPIPACGGEVAPLVESLRVLQTNVKLLVGQIQEASHVVDRNTAEMADSNRHLAERTEAQSRFVEDTTVSMTEMGAAIHENANAAHTVMTLVNDATATAVEGAGSARDVAATMETIRDSSQRAGEIIGVIDGIAFQTNILALNASVEAARAGAHGRGFAVVATEVRALAQRSAEAAREIRGLLENSAERVAHGVRLVGKARATMELVTTKIQQVDTHMAAIADAGREQSAGIGQMNEALSHIEEITQQNARQVETAAANAARMRTEAEELTRLVNSFRLVSSRRALPAPARHAALPLQSGYSARS